MCEELLDLPNSETEQVDAALVLSEDSHDCCNAIVNRDARVKSHHIHSHNDGAGRGLEVGKRTPHTLECFNSVLQVCWHDLETLIEDAFEDYGYVFKWAAAGRNDWSERNIGLVVFWKTVHFREAVVARHHGCV